MKGMELSRLYFETYGRPLIEGKFSQYKREIATGLVGEGSQCFEFDDEYSQDHDFGPGFCIWLSKEVYDKIGYELQIEYDNLPKKFMGYNNDRQIAQGRTGVLEIESFYHKYTNCGSTPKNLIDWMKIPERFLAIATNGRVFYDGNGKFSITRENLLKFYPDDVLKKKLASKLAIMAQSGQYNYMRCAKRNDFQATYLACNEFVKNALSAMFLLNRKYMPFYKWSFRATENFAFLKKEVEILKNLVLIPDTSVNANQKFQMIEDICSGVANELKRQGFCTTNDSFLEAHAVELMQKIVDTRIKGLHIMADFD